MKFKTSLRFKKGTPSLKRRLKPIQHVVLHWTASENPAATVFRTLNQRNLSIDYIVDGEGLIWECNPDIKNLYTLHAGIINSTSIGIEIVNYGFAPKAPKKGEDRVVDKQSIHGRIKDVARFRPAQVDAVYALCTHLCNAYNIPFEVLGGTTTAPVADFRGIIGHFHINRLKNDPGPLLLTQLKDRHRAVTQLNRQLGPVALSVERRLAVQEEPLNLEEMFKDHVVTWAKPEVDGKSPPTEPEYKIPSASLWQRMVDLVTGWMK